MQHDALAVQRPQRRTARPGLTALFLSCLALAGAPARAASPAADVAGADLVKARCAGCHQLAADGGYARIGAMRKTPEGWAMTIFRMQNVHHLALTDDERSAIVRYLADTRGLAPAEAAAGRFALERRPNAQDLDVGPELGVMCGRCHSNARSALQRRGADEWLKLAHFHVGQWPSLEYQQNGRDRYWWDIATKELPAKLAALYPVDSPAWSAWQARPHADLAGAWLVSGHVPGRGDYRGTATLQRQAPDEYTATYDLAYADGSKLAGQSKAIVYTGYEWRGNGSLGGSDVREVFAAGADGNSIDGRWFDEDHAEVGGDWHAVRAGRGSRILAIAPAAVKAGSTTHVVLFGDKLGATASFGAGTSAKVTARSANTLELDVTAAANAHPGYRQVTSGGARLDERFAVYSTLERVDVTPHYGIARLGGGHTDPVTAQFEATGYIDVTATDGSKKAVSLGVLPAQWSVEPFNDIAKAGKDVDFAGAIDQTGRYLPAGAGPDPKREYSTDNAGDLSVVAQVKDGEQASAGKAHLVVTVQRWNTPPIY